MLFACIGKKIFLFNRQLNTEIGGTVISWYPRLGMEERSGRFGSFIRSDSKFDIGLGGEVLNRIFFLLSSFSNVGNGKVEKINTLARVLKKKMSE